MTYGLSDKIRSRIRPQHDRTCVAALTGKPGEKLDKVALASTPSANYDGSLRIQGSKHSIERSRNASSNFSSDSPPRGSSNAARAAGRDAGNDPCGASH